MRYMCTKINTMQNQLFTVHVEIPFFDKDSWTDLRAEGTLFGIDKHGMYFKTSLDNIVRFGLSKIHGLFYGDGDIIQTILTRSRSCDLSLPCHTDLYFQSGKYYCDRYFKNRVVIIEHYSDAGDTCFLFGRIKNAFDDNIVYNNIMLVNMHESDEVNMKKMIKIIEMSLIELGVSLDDIRSSETYVEYKVKEHYSGLYFS